MNSHSMGYLCISITSYEIAYVVINLTGDYIVLTLYPSEYGCLLSIGILFNFIQQNKGVTTQKYLLGV